MAEQTSDSPKNESALGRHLGAIRKDRGFSLRQVEELTNKVVSNAYLSQIEGGKIQQPSPNMLHSLATVYKISYEHLMELAGYISNGGSREGAHGRAATFAELNLTQEEEKELLEYLRFRRSMDKKNEGG
ncbi:helix-turn-helix domain-containing protein [Rhodoferax sp. OV413]|uniref:helix-turn-helix domain-containing protein n=1 Tax=Rhodoferax sp. OV413 TaxID=1855285 RepID=UPI000B817EED|nr:helix-turn-helix transcriptional regulator [Rhodoferax sp. OV413]